MDISEYAVVGDGDRKRTGEIQIAGEPAAKRASPEDGKTPRVVQSKELWVEAMKWLMYGDDGEKIIRDDLSFDSALFFKRMEIIKNGPYGLALAAQLKAAEEYALSALARCLTAAIHHRFPQSSANWMAFRLGWSYSSSNIHMLLRSRSPDFLHFADDPYKGVIGTIGWWKMRRGNFIEDPVQTILRKSGKFTKNLDTFLGEAVTTKLTFGDSGPLSFGPGQLYELVMEFADIHPGRTLNISRGIDGGVVTAALMDELSVIFGGSPDGLIYDDENDYGLVCLEHKSTQQDKKETAINTDRSHYMMQLALNVALAGTLIGLLTELVILPDDKKYTLTSIFIRQHDCLEFLVQYVVPALYAGYKAIIEAARDGIDLDDLGLASKKEIKRAINERAHIFLDTMITSASARDLFDEILSERRMRNESEDQNIADVDEMGEEDTDGDDEEDDEEDDGEDVVDLDLDSAEGQMFRSREFVLSGNKTRLARELRSSKMYYPWMLELHSLLPKLETESMSAAKTPAWEGMFMG